MSAIRRLARAAAITGAVLGTTFVPARPAAAADAACQLTRLPGRMSAGGGGAPVVGQVRSSTRETLDVVQISWRIRLSELDADEVTLSDVSLQEEDGEIRGTEQLSFVGPFGRTLSHTLEFLTGAPSGRATLTMRAFIRDSDRWKEACSSRVTTTVQRARGTSTATASATPLDTGLAVASESGPGAAAEPRAAASDSDSGLLPLYLLGLLLVAGGGGLVALLLLRRPRDEEPAVYEPAYVAGYGGAAHRPPPQAGGPAPVYGPVRPAGYDGPPTRAYDDPRTRAYPPAVDPFAPPGDDAPTAVIPKVTDDRPRPGGWQPGPPA